MACNVTRRILDAVNPRHLNSHNDDHGKQTQQGRLRFEKVWNSEIPEVADHYNCLRPIDMAWHLIYSSRRGLWTRSTSRKAIKYSCKHSSLWNVHSIKTTASLLFWVSCLLELHEFKKNSRKYKLRPPIITGSKSVQTACQSTRQLKITRRGAGM